MLNKHHFSFTKILLFFLAAIRMEFHSLITAYSSLKRIVVSMYHYQKKSFYCSIKSGQENITELDIEQKAKFICWNNP